MAVVFKGNNIKFPANESELTSRLVDIENLINAEKSNVAFVESAFKLMENCGLINQENIKFLTDATALKRRHRNFKFPYMSNEGVLRQVTNYNDVFDANGFPRFYKGNDRRVEIEGKMYVIANDWYQDNTPACRKSYHGLQNLLEFSNFSSTARTKKTFGNRNYFVFNK